MSVTSGIELVHRVGLSNRQACAFQFALGPRKVLQSIQLRAMHAGTVLKSFDPIAP